MKHDLATCTLASILLFSNAAPATTAHPDPLEISGQMQLWRRACDADGRCTVPQPLGASRPLAGVIAAPTPGHGTTTTLTASFDAAETGDPDGWTANVQIFRKTKSAPDDSSYTAYQVTLKNLASGEVLALCSSFEAERWTGHFFPVGACGGVLPRPRNGESRPRAASQVMIGVSYYR